jgi:glycosyltransferase involved in cell wall biosynthesis
MGGGGMDLNLALIICTRNRPQMLNILLNSIKLSETKPNSVIVVSSGDDISEIINIHRNSLDLLHHHTSKIGQSNQKLIAIQMLNPQTNWVLFLDDDLELMPSTLTNACLRIKLVQNENVNGIGTRLINKSLDFRKLQRRRPRLEKQIGKIKPSGRVTKYAFDIITTTEWLNGASIWRKDCLNHYTLPVLDSTYAAYEDVIFSSNVAYTSKLIYDPLITLNEQIPHSQVVLSYKQFKYITLWTGYLVCSRLDTKVISFKLLTLGRLFFFLLSKRGRGGLKLSKIIRCLEFVFKILMLSGNKLKSKIILVELLSHDNARF